MKSRLSASVPAKFQVISFGIANMQASGVRLRDVTRRHGAWTGMCMLQGHLDEVNAFLTIFEIPCK